MSGTYIAGLIAFLGGSVISVINAVITAKQVNSESQSVFSGSLTRQIIGIAYMAGTYFLLRHIGMDPFWPLLGAAFGLTIPAILFAITIANHMKGDD